MRRNGAGDASLAASGVACTPAGKRSRLMATSYAQYDTLLTSETASQGSVGFFHPFADGGGGGERVLW